MDFSGKVVVITGGATGIGKETAQAFLGEGARVVLSGRPADVLAATAAELDPTGARVGVAAGDVAEGETARRFVATAVDRFDGVDVLVNNAGVFRPTPFLEHTEADLDLYLDTILRGTFLVSQAAIPEMRKRGRGAIVNTGSMWALQAVGATPSSAYSTAMAGRHALTRNLALEFATDNIWVNAVAPAVVETPIHHGFLTPEQVADVLPTFNAFHALGRNGQPRDIAAAILFLASDDASWITGVVLPVDGGATAGRPAA